MKQYLLLVLLPVLAFSNGPDRGGYRWIDSDEVGGPEFEWIDITGSGTQIPLVDDDNRGPFGLGFSCDFYGQLFDSVRVCSDGWLSFTSESHQFHHYAIPSEAEPNNLLAPLWVDLNPAQGGSVYYLADTANGRFIVSWIDVPFYFDTDSVTFQVVLDTSGTILFQYLRLPSLLRLGVDSCAVGIEDDSGLTGLEYFCNGSPAENLPHDRLAVRFYRLEHDACPHAVLRPVGGVLAGDSVVPLVVVWNPGRSPASFPVTVRLGGGYEEEVAVTDLAPLAEAVVQFPAWVPAAETCALELITNLGGDECPENDTLRSEVVGSYAGELKYDDGGVDAWYMKNGSPASEWAGAVRFSVPYDQFRLLGARVFVDDTTPFSKVMVCPDSDGAPNVGSPYLLAESVAASQPETWIDVATDTQVATSDDVWLLAFWQQRATEPKIGEDQGAPIDHRTYFGSPTVRWFAYNSGDLLARLRIDGLTGITEDGGRRTEDGRRLVVSPNPFSGTAVFLLDGSAPSRSLLQVRDVTGRRVRELQLSGAGRAVWDGRDRNDRMLPAGVYFVEAGAGADRCVSQVLLTR